MSGENACSVCGAPIEPDEELCPRCEHDIEDEQRERDE